MVLAPVVDVGSAGGIGDRSFGDTSEVVTAKAGAYAAGCARAACCPVLKHFPGQGHADADTHESVATVPELALLRTSDLVPYDTLLDEDPGRGDGRPPRRARTSPRRACRRRCRRRPSGCSAAATSSTGW